MESGALENDAAARSDQPAELAAALRALFQRLCGHLLELLECMPAFPALVFISRHLSSLILVHLCIGFTCGTEFFDSPDRFRELTVRPPSRTNAERTHLAEYRQQAGHYGVRVFHFMCFLSAETSSASR